MPFFAPRPDRPAFEPDDFEEPWYEVDDRTIGGLVPVQLVLAEGAQVAIVISQLTADPGGLLFRLTVVRRKGAERWDQVSRHYGGDVLDDGLRFGVGLADGTVVELHPHWMYDGAEPGWTLRSRGGTGGNARYDQELRLEPAPPPGPVAFACAWPELGVEEVVAQVDGDLLATARSEARILWPEDPEEVVVEDRWLNYAPDGMARDDEPDEDAEG